jgi:hypothetical protein
MISRRQWGESKGAESENVMTVAQFRDENKSREWLIDFASN